MIEQAAIGAEGDTVRRNHAFTDDAHVASGIDAKENAGLRRAAAPENRREVDRASVERTVGIRLDVIDGVDCGVADLRQHRMQDIRLEIEAHDTAAAGADHRAIGI